MDEREKVAVMASGYSDTPLEKKLGIKPGARIKIINAPSGYKKLFSDLPADLKFNSKGKQDIIHLFIKSIDELYAMLPDLKSEIEQAGAIWVSWPKKSSGIKTDVAEDRIRECAVTNGLVDVKVCAVDETWSALKLVIPLKLRT